MGEQGIDKRSVATIFSTVQITVQTAYILTPKTLHNQHHHIFLVHHRAWSGLMDWGVVREHLLFVGEIFRFLKHIFTDGANERERRVEHNGSLGGVVHILVGVAHRDGANRVCQTATHTTNNARHHQQYRYQCGKAVAPPANGVSLQIVREIKSPKPINQHHAYQQKIPMANQFGAEDAGKVTLVAKLAEHGAGGAARGVLEIHAVAKVHHHDKGIDHHKQPFTHLAIGGRFL